MESIPRLRAVRQEEDGIPCLRGEGRRRFDMAPQPPAGAHVAHSDGRASRKSARGATALSAAKLGRPHRLATREKAAAPGGNEKTERLALSWTASAELDAMARPRKRLYGARARRSAEGSYSSVGTTGIETRFTDRQPYGRRAPGLHVRAKTGRGEKRSRPFPAVNTRQTPATFAPRPGYRHRAQRNRRNQDGQDRAWRGRPAQVQIITVATHTSLHGGDPESARREYRPDAVGRHPGGLTAYVVDGRETSSLHDHDRHGTSGTGSRVKNHRATRGRDR